MTRRPRMRPGEGITGSRRPSARRSRSPRRRISTRASSSSRTCPRTSTSRSSPCRSWPGEKLEGALNVRTREPRDYTEAEIDLLVAIASQVAQTIEHAKLYADAQRRVHELEALAQISEAVSESLYLEESLEAIVKTTIDRDRGDRRRARARGRQDRVARRPRRRARAAPAAALEAPADRRARLRPRHAVHRRGPRPARGDRPPCRRRARARARGDARRARPGDPPPGQEQPPDRRLAAAAPGARAGASTRGGRSTDSVNRILAIAAVHEVLTEHREDDVDLAELIERLRAMLVQGLVAGKEVEAKLEPVRSPATARRRSLSSSASCFQNALEHGGGTVRIELAQRNGDVSLAIADDGGGIDGRRRGHGALDRARARARRAPAARSRSTSEPGLRAEVVFPGVRILIAEDETIIRHRPALAARVGRVRGVRGGEGRRGGGRARPLRAARPRAARREDAAARRDRGGAPDPRRAADPDRDGDGVRRAGARRAGGRGGRLRLPRQAVPRDRPAARDRDRTRAARRAARRCAKRPSRSPTRSPPARRSSARRAS